jgi:ABC-type taurine transport system ATPase subunit
MPLLRMRSASFAGRGGPVGPVTLDVYPGRQAALAFACAREAATVALMAAGIVKATSGRVLIDEFDPRVQSVRCKRIAAFVPHEPLPLDAADFKRYIAYRAALWNVDAARALASARILRERLDDVHEAFAYPLIGALIAEPKLVVLDRPQAAYASQILAVLGERALFSTHASLAAARAFVPMRNAAAVQAMT